MLSFSVDEDANEEEEKEKEGEAATEEKEEDGGGDHADGHEHPERDRCSNNGINDGGSNASADAHVAADADGSSGSINAARSDGKDAVGVPSADAAADDTRPGELAVAGTKKARFMKNPEVDTSFLPDREREETERAERERLRQLWAMQQETIKNEEIDVTYSYWDGTGHRHCVRIKKGFTIEKFLERVLEQLRKDFRELRVSSVENLMYIKEDLIIPHVRHSGRCAQRAAEDH